jgi:hypothetical protein
MASSMFWHARSMTARLDKDIAELYDHCGGISNYHKGNSLTTHVYFSNVHVDGIVALNKVLGGSVVHVYEIRTKVGDTTRRVTINNKQQILVLVHMMYPFLKNEKKKKKIRKVWRDAGWCICNDEL